MNRYGYYCRVQRITATFRSRLQSVRNGRDPVNQPCSIATSPSKRPTQLAHSTGGIVPVPVLLSRSTSDAWPFLLRGSRPREPRDFPQRVPTFALAIARGTLHGLQRDSPAATARLSVPSWPSPGIFSCRCHAANQNANLVPNSIVPVPFVPVRRFLFGSEAPRGPVVESGCMLPKERPTCARTHQRGLTPLTSSCESGFSCQVGES